MIRLICQINVVTVSIAFFLVLAFVIFVILSPFLSQHLPREFVATPELIVLAIVGIVFFTLLVGGFAAILRCVQLLEIMERRTRAFGPGGSVFGGIDAAAEAARIKMETRSEPQFKSR